MSGSSQKFAVMVILVGWSSLTWGVPKGSETGHYPLPRNKAATEPCKQAAMSAQPGTALDFRAEDAGWGRQRYRFVIESVNRRRWAVYCDPDSLAIVDTVPVD